MDEDDAESPADDEEDAVEGTEIENICICKQGARFTNL
jgi:hypothetical protein